MCPPKNKQQPEGVMKKIVIITALVLGLPAIGATAEDASAGGQGKRGVGKQGEGQHERLTFRHAGREMRLTDEKGNVAKEILV